MGSCSEQIQLDERVPLAGVFSMGRSGSTWLGAILDSHPDVAYRFEPFHRLRTRQPLAGLLEKLDRGEGDEALLEALYLVLKQSHPLLCKPPFFRKDNAPNHGRLVLNALGRKVGPLARLYQALYTPRGRPLVIFKEVTSERRMGLLLQMGMPAIYLVRHPCAVVASLVQGQSQGLMPQGRLTVLGNLLRAHDEALAERYVPRVDELSAAEKNALLWRIDVEQGIATARRFPHALIMSYEDLCLDPLGRSSEAFEHLGLTITAQTEQFLTASTKSEQAARRHYQEQNVNRYFSVFRDPQKSMNKWRQQLTPAQQAEVMAIVDDSDAFRYCRHKGHWTGRKRRLAQEADLLHQRG